MHLGIVSFSGNLYNELARQMDIVKYEKEESLASTAPVEDG